ncbi:hypothetical protein D9757_012633 [Collybiopsis confluens]|uniref:DUF6534 domain-containing protein n=1 Tax=Collybiopsis confluens TaxID=2823264 RepID=A0A8H5FWJ8_9AGAR|nr:hypothetical protein D9757_012633 [Collybiopsis confluens]
MTNQEASLGAIIIGTPLAFLLTGMLLVQCYIYWKTSRSGDTWHIQSLVAILLLLDLIHSMFVWIASWKWFVTGREKDLDKIPVTLSLSIIVTAISTLMAHSMYSWRIFKLSGRNYWITLPIMTLAVLRVVAATFSGGYMIHLKSFETFRVTAGWVISLGLALSCIVDVLITGAMMAILRRTRVKSLTMDSVIDSLIIYTLENGSVTAITTVASLVCWVAMDNLIFLGLHFVIAKLYANSVLAMLNYRQFLRRTGESRSRSGLVDMEVIRLRSVSSSTPKIPVVAVSINRTMQMHTDFDTRRK